MWLKNFLTWKKKSKVLIANKSNLNLKQIMLSYCSKCRKIRKVQVKKQWRLKTEEQCFYQNAKCVIIKSRNLLKNEKLKDY